LRGGGGSFFKLYVEDKNYDVRERSEKVYGGRRKRTKGSQQRY